MTMNFDELFSHCEGQIFPKFDLKNAGIIYKQGEALSYNTTLFGKLFSSLFEYTFEVTDLPENSYEITAYYVH